MFLENCNIIDNIKIENDKYLLRIKSNKAYKISKAGQFFMLESNTFLRRPISIHYIENDIIEFYYQVKGEGTKYLSRLKKDDTINIQGPLGNGFDTSIKNKKILIIAGGMGLAPMKLLIENLINNNITLIMGGANENAIKIIKRFDLSRINLYITTDDGSVGDKTNVIEKTKELLENNDFDIVYTCGPNIMISKLIKLIKSIKYKNITCYASLEERMACGVNACLGCCIETNDKEKPLQKICYDGPVFNCDILNY